MKLALLSSALLAVLPTPSGAQLSMMEGDIDFMGHEGDHAESKAGKMAGGSKSGKSHGCTIEDLDGKDFLFDNYPVVPAWGGFVNPDSPEPTVLRFARPPTFGQPTDPANESTRGVMWAEFLCSNWQPDTMVAAQTGWVKDDILPFNLYGWYTTANYTASRFAVEYNCKTEEMVYGGNAFYFGWAVSTVHIPGVLATEGVDFCYTTHAECNLHPPDRFECPEE